MSGQQHDPTWSGENGRRRRGPSDPDGRDQGFHPRTGEPAGDPVPHTTEVELDLICDRAAAAAPELAAMSPDQRGQLLRTVADALGEHTEELVALADTETALGTARLTSELTRTRRQLEMFAEVLLEGSYLEAVIDPPDPDATPVPRPDLRRMLVPRGPVAVYSASNFPFAFSVAGGDTASAWAAGCPVVLKAHPGHPGLSARCARVVGDALARAGAPTGTFGVVYGMAAGQALVRHPAISAAAFTGSLSGGQALAELAAERPEPIPFYGELGALNPVVVTAGAIAERAEAIVTGFVGSYLLGTGQFCTKPGLLFLPTGHDLERPLAEAVEHTSLGPLLHAKIREGYERATTAVASTAGVRSLLPEPAPLPAETAGWYAAPRLLAVRVPDLLANPEPLLTECFGPAALVVEYDSVEELLAALAVLPGSLTGSLHASLPAETAVAESVLAALTARAGRVIVGGWPTGVAVTWAMQHGGPWPATTDAGHTSVGVTAMRRFQRPVAYQNTPDSLLPPALRDDNPWRIPRRLNGVMTPAA